MPSGPLRAGASGGLRVPRLGRIGLPDFGAILEVPDSLVGTRDDRLALTQSLDHLKMLVARYADLDRPKRRRALPHHENSFGFLLVELGTQGVGRHSGL